MLEFCFSQGEDAAWKGPLTKTGDNRPKRVTTANTQHFDTHLKTRKETLHVFVVFVIRKTNNKSNYEQIFIRSLCNHVRCYKRHGEASTRHKAGTVMAK